MPSASVSTANRGKAGILPQHAQPVANVLKESPHVIRTAVQSSDPLSWLGAPEYNWLAA